MRLPFPGTVTVFDKDVVGGGSGTGTHHFICARASFRSAYQQCLLLPGDGTPVLPFPLFLRPFVEYFGKFQFLSSQRQVDDAQSKARPRDLVIFG